MANKESSKLKLLYLYEYFMKEVDPDGPGVVMSDMVSMLEARTGETFDRKSIYADIDRLNEFARLVGSVKNNDEFITHQGKRYFRAGLNGELQLAEATLISDSLRTTEFIPEDIYQRFEDMFPAYFNQKMNNETARLYSRYTAHSDSVVIGINNMLTFFRDCIKDGEPLMFKYGYKISRAVKGVNHVVSPIILDWSNSHYYLIAIDNMALLKASGNTMKYDEDTLSRCLRRFRLDRIDSYRVIVPGSDPVKYIRDNVPSNAAIFDDKTKIAPADRKKIASECLKYHTFANEDKLRKRVRNYIENSFEGYNSQENIKLIPMSIEASDKDSVYAWKNVLQTFSVLKDAFAIKERSISESDKDKKLSFILMAPDVPPLYKYLFSLFTFDYVKISIQNDEIASKLRDYAERVSRSL